MGKKTEVIKVNANTKLEIAVEIMAAKIAKSAREGIDSKEIQKLLNERTKMYQGDKKIIDKVIEKYGEEIKK